MASADLRQELDCSICQSIYTDPVTLRCGHNFCRGCIDRMFDTHEKWSEAYTCPECREEYRNRPKLQRNITLCKIVGKLTSIRTDQETGFFCSYCIHSFAPAAKSCLLCEAHLCDNHLRVHSKSPEHVLCDPTTVLGNRKCSIHKKVLEYYCTNDATCICASGCLIGEHRGHQMELLDEASEKKKEKLRDVLQKLSTKRADTEKRLWSLQERSSEDKIRAAGVTETVTALFRDIRRQLGDLEKREPDTGDLCDTEDTEDLCDTEDTETHDTQVRGAGDLNVGLISETLHTLSDIITGINTGIYVQEPADILLDSTTAGNYIHISGDGKTASRSHIYQNHPVTPERFQCDQVISSRRFSSGRHYWEVDVSKSVRWEVGMCYPSIDRRGLQSDIGYNNKSWCLHRCNNRCSVIHDSKEIQLSDNIPCDRVRVYLDYEVGQLSFYSLCDPIRHLHTYNTTFTEPLHAALRVVKGCITISGGIRRRET
ncbi:E3 ubiquitin-protein ligase TRIM39-like [Pseudophryne corroboree]|uniref:E3 ubiquitin-protein ligase TRIM39-like n=1 Tax=Pseudophryne corroboree TaxID=495146 RepID=UPI0030817D02